jgi:uncharacterized protein
MANSTVVIYHANCIDGLSAAGSAYLKFQDTADYIPLQYGDEVDIGSLTGKSVFILDYSIKKDVFEEIANAAENAVLLDHHQTTFEEFCSNESPDSFIEVNNNYFIKLDNNKSGAMLAYEHFFPSADIPQIIQYVDDRDRWQFKMAGSKAINEGLRFHAKTVKDYALQIQLDKVAPLKEAGHLIMDILDGHIASIMKHATLRTDDFGYLTVFANCPLYLFSEVGNRLCEKYPEALYAGMYFSSEADRKTIFGLRSIGDFDVTTIAKKFGGGGHYHAAGFSIKES